MAELWSSVLRKVEFVVDETYPAEEISKWSIEGVACCLQYHVRWQRWTEGGIVKQKKETEIGEL